MIGAPFVKNMNLLPISTARKEASQYEINKLSNCPGLLSHHRVNFSNPSYPNLRQPSVFLIFDASRFSLNQFSVHQIHLPDSIARSALRRRAEFFYGRYAARLALFALLEDQDFSRQDITVGSMGEPQWPVGTTGSISHSNGIAAAIVCHKDEARGVGLDIEEIINQECCNAIMHTVIDKSELKLLKNLSGLLSIEALMTIAFSVKESFYKGIFNEVMRFVDFGAAKIIGIDAETQRITLKLPENLSVSLCKGSEYVASYHWLDNRTIISHFIYR